MKELPKKASPWQNVNTLKHCDVDLLFSFDLNKGVEHKLISFALNLLCVSKKYELIFITYGQYIYVYEMNKFMDTNDINENDYNKRNFLINFNHHDITKNNNCFKNMNKIKYLYNEIKKEFYLKKSNIPNPVLILSPHMYSKGYVNIRCEEKEKSEKSVLICVGWSEDTNIYYVEKIVECINIKKKLKNLLEKNLYSDKTCENISYQMNNSPHFQGFHNDPYHFLKKLKIDENNFILNLIYNGECINNYSNEFIDILQLYKNDHFDYTKNKIKEKRSILLRKLEEEKKNKSKSIVSKEKKKNWSNKIFANKNVQKGLRNPFLKIKKKDLYKKNYKCILRSKKYISSYSDKKKVESNMLKKKFKISDFYSSLGSEEEYEEEKESERIEKNKKNCKKNNYNSYLDNDEKEIEEINFYRKFREKVYIGYNLRSSLELNEKNDYINSFRQDNQLVNEYLKSSSDENKESDYTYKLPIYEKTKNILKLYEHKFFFKSLKKKKKHKKGNIFDNKKILSNIINLKNNNYLYYPQKKCEINIKEYYGDNKEMQLKYLNKNIENYMLYMKQLNLLKEERKKFVNFCKLYIKHKYYEEYSKKLETFLDPSIKIKYHNIWKQFNIFTFNLFNVDYNDKILRSVHVYLQPDIVFNNKIYVKSDTSTWAISFNFKKNLLAIGSNTHNIHIYNLNNFYYFRRRYNYDEALNYFKNTFVHKNFQVNNLFSDNREYVFFSNNEKNRKKRKKNIKSSNFGNIYHNAKKKKHNLLNINTIIKDSQININLNATKKKKFYNCSNDLTKIQNINIQNILPYNFNLSKIKKKNFEKFRLNKSYFYKEHISFNYLSDSFYEIIKLHNYKHKNVDNLVLDKNNYVPILKNYLDKSEEIYKNYQKKSIKRKTLYNKSCYSDDDYTFYYNKIISKNNHINNSIDFVDKFNKKIYHLNYFDSELKLGKEKNSCILKKNYKNISYVEKMVTNILLNKSKIPVDLSLFFILRKENLKNILLTISYNFPSDSIVLFLKQACIGDEIFHIRCRICYNIYSTIHKMKKLYIKEFSSKKNFHLKLFDKNTLLINSENFLKNWYLKYFRKNIFLNFNSSLEKRKMKKKSKGNLSNNMLSQDNYTYNSYKTIFKKNKINKLKLNKNKEKKNKKNQMNNEKLKVISKNLLHESTSSDETLNKRFIYSTKKNYNLLEKEKHYVFSLSSVNDYRNINSKNKIIHYTLMYSYKRANFVLKKISKIFRDFIKDRYKYIFYNKNQLCSNEKFIYIINNKKGKKNLTNYNEVSIKYIKELKTVIKNIQSNTQYFCLNKKNNIKKIEEGLPNKKILIIYELRDHNNNLLDIIHLSNEIKDDSEKFSSDTQSDKLREDSNIYYTLNFSRDENNNKRKCIIKNNFNMAKIFSNSKIAESHLSGIVNNTIQMEIKNLRKVNSHLLNMDRKKSINSSSDFNDESDKSSSIPSIKKFGNHIKYRTNISHINIPIRESVNYLNAQINEGSMQNHNQNLRGESNLEIPNNNSSFIQCIHNFRILQNNFINNTYNNNQNYESITENYLNNSRNNYENNVLNDSHNILNRNNRSNYISNVLSNNIDNSEDSNNNHINNTDIININENLHNINSLDNNNNLNVSSTDVNINLNNNSRISTSRDGNDENAGISINLSNIANLNLNTNLTSNNDANNIQNSSFFYNNEYMFLSILYNNILNMRIDNRNFSNLLDSNNLPFNRNILTNVNNNNSNRYLNILMNSEVNNNDFCNQMLQSRSIINKEQMKKRYSKSDIKCKDKKNIKKRDSNSPFHEISLNMRNICRKNKYDVTIKNIYTLSKSADKILVDFKKNSEILFDFVIVCEGLHIRNWETKENIKQGDAYKKRRENEGNHEKVKKDEIFQKKIRKQRKLQKHEEKQKEIEQNFIKVNTLEEDNMNEYIKPIFSSNIDYPFLKNENNSTYNNNNVLIEKIDNKVNQNIQNCNLKDTNLTNPLYKDTNLINLSNVSSSFTSDFEELSDMSYSSSSENFSDFNFISESSLDECSNCEYSNMCIENKNEIDFNSTYKFLKHENSLLYAKNYNVSIKKSEKSLSKYCLKGKSSHKKKKTHNKKTKIITLNINDFDYEPLLSKKENNENTEKNDSDRKEILNKKKINDTLTIKSEWIQKVLLQEDYYEVKEIKEKKQKKNNEVVEERRAKGEYEKEMDDKNKILNIMNILKKCKLNDNMGKTEDCKIKYDEKLRYTNLPNNSNKVKNKNNIFTKKIKQNFNYNISSLIHYKEKEIRNYFYDEKHIKHISKEIRRKFLNKINKEYVEKFVSEIMWTFSNVIFYSADWYDILYKLFFDVSSRFYELVIKHHQHNIPCVKFSPDGNFLLSCSVDKSVVLWYPYNIENFNLERNFNIYDHILPHSGEKKNKKTYSNCFLNNIYSNISLEINYANKKNVFEKLYHDTKLWQIKKEQELIKKKNNDILCKQSLKYMGWSCDFIIKKNVSNFDFLVDLFHKEKFLDRYNFNYSSYFPFSYINLNNFLNLFEKYSIFHLFRCSFLRIKNKLSENFNNFIMYLYRTNIKKTKYLEENKIKYILEILTDKNKNKKYNIKKIKRLYSAMKYISLNLLKPYILIHPLKCDKYYPNHKVKLDEESLLDYPHILTDYNMTYSDDSESVLNRNFKSKIDKLNFFIENNRKKNKMSNLYYNLSESEDSNLSNDELSSSNNGIKTKYKINMNDDESDINYLEKNMYEKSLFYKYIHKIRDEFSLNFLLYEEKADISKWTFTFQKLMNQYTDMKCFRGLYNHIKNKILIKYINKYENLKPNLYFNFHITRNYNELKILKEILLNHSIYFNEKNRILSNDYNKINNEFKLYLKLIKKQKLLNDYCKKEKWRNLKKKRNNNNNNNNNSSFKNKGYTIILKNNINNFHNVINNIINISYKNKIIKHHKFFKENNIYNTNNCNNKKKKKVNKDSEFFKSYKKHIQEDIFHNYFNDFKKYQSDFYSTDSFNSYLSDTFKKYKKKTKKIKKNMNNNNIRSNLKKRDLKESKKKKKKSSNYVDRTFSYEKGKEICYLKKKKKKNQFFNSNNVLKKGDLKTVLQNEKKKFNICFLNSEKENYKINYFSNINILQNLYKYCGRGLILVNVRYIENSFKNKNIVKKKNDEKKSSLKKHNNIIFQTDIYICKTKTTKNDTNCKSYLQKKSRDIIFILKVNIEELKNYLKRKFIFEKKFINDNFYINLKVVKIIYLLTLRNCKLLDKDINSTEGKMDKINKKLLNRFLSKEEYNFFLYLTNNLFKGKKYTLTRENIYKNIIKMRNYIFNSKNIDISSVKDYPLSDYEKKNSSKDKFQSSFNLFFSLLPQYKKNIVMLNISTFRFLYSHINKKKKKKNVCCINKNKEIHEAIVSKEEKKKLSKYLILSADKCKLYLLKIKFTKITKNLFTTKFIPISVQTIPKEHILPSAFKTSRISLLKIIYEKSCILLANQYSNNIFIYFVHKCVYTNSYFLIPYFILPLYTELIGKELFYCFNKDISKNENNYVVNNINYNLKKLLVINSKEAPEESNFFIAGFDVIYIEGKDNNFELTIFAILLSNIIFCYKLKFHYY
ncbi:conserved Plasmodium protein, unknown function [Plasmodium gallinaceum]|uniref:Uncharacterized protein n=1 Tax=Plasmodium gallinaceum TaxID=5849 RepID=A0A1J1GSV8_PLAGA|nr:conserved Plasmodium protein, unknown function [Plasmodium gallinaceum]CRG95622.1 conserved Plasmodium protein, unknown function [Plasmodium gallinaceum]